VTPDERSRLDTSIRAELSTRLERVSDRGAISLLGAGRDLESSLEEGRRFLERMAPGGWSTPGWPVDHGGRGWDEDHLEVFAEVLDDFERPDLYPFLIGLGTAGPMIIRHGTADQQHRFLDGIRTGEDLWCQLFSEPDAGSDLVSLRTRAHHQDGRWRIQGHKLWASRASVARFGLLLARSNPDAPPHHAMTVFLVDMSSAGISLSPIRQMNGDVHFYEVFLDDVVLDDSDRLGPIDGGWRVAMDTLGAERASAAALGGRGVGPEAVLELLDGNRNHQTSTGRHATVIRDRAARAFSELTLLHEGARHRRPEGHKLRFAAAARSLAALSYDVHGPQSMLDDGPWSAVETTAPSVSIRGGTDEVQRTVIGERVLGLPREPRPDMIANRTTTTTQD
jgi:alkylation response protein AidB-like acyl-CoA dehydrogenase